MTNGPCVAGLGAAIEQEVGQCGGEAAGILPVGEVTERRENDQLSPADPVREEAGVPRIDDVVLRSVQDEGTSVNTALPEVARVPRPGLGLRAPCSRMLARRRSLVRENAVGELRMLGHGRRG